MNTEYIGACLYLQVAPVRLHIYMTDSEDSQSMNSGKESILCSNAGCIETDKVLGTEKF